MAHLWRWSAVAAVLATFIFGVLGTAGRLDGGKAAHTAVPGMGAATPGGQAAQEGIPGKLEGNRAQVRPTPPLYTTAPSPLRPLDSAIFGPNMRANTDATTYAQQEPSIAVNPTNPLNIIASAKDERSAPGPATGTKEVWEYASVDGGQTWANVKAPLLGPNATQQSDPINIFRDDGVAYACYLGFKEGGPSATDTGVYVTKSTDGGVTWTNTVLAVPEVIAGSSTAYSTDKQWLAVDNNPASPYYHYMYLSWTEFGACGGCIHFVRSTDGGATWSDRSTQLSSATSNQQFSMPTVLWNGNVLVTWASGSSIVYRISTDGGVTFRPQTVAGAMSQVPNSLPGANWRVSSIPVAAADRSTPANVVVTWNDYRNSRANGSDIYYIRSADGGQTWNAPARLNDDPAGVVRQQVEPWVTASPNGTFHAIWYDEREDATSNIIFNIYYSQSTDGGATWSANTRISDATSDLNVGIPQGTGWNSAAGDYINLSATNDRVYAAWTDTRSGTNEDVYVAPGILAGGSATPTLAASSPTSTQTAASGATGTATATSPWTSTATATSITTGTATSTPATSTTATPVGTATVVACPVQFQDVLSTNTFYPYVRCLACQSIVGGYPCGGSGEPCGTSGNPYFRPGAPISRGQIAKIVAQAAGLNDAPGPQIYEDVPPDATFFVFIQRLSNRGYMSGYPCGRPSEPCAQPPDAARPYFRPAANASRGQLSKIVSNAAGFTGDVIGQYYTDVPDGSPFYLYVQRLTAAGAMSGYPCGGPDEPCDAQSRTYFRPNADVTRGQASKIVSNTFFPNCQQRVTDNK